MVSRGIFSSRADRRAWSVAALLFWCATATLLGGSASYGQEQDPDLKEAPTAPATQPAAQNGANSTTSGSPVPVKERSLLDFYFKALGLGYTTVFLVISFC